MKPNVRKKQSSTLCILPTALMVEEELKKIARETGVVTGYRVMTFPELMNILSNDLPVKQRQISSIGELLLIKDAADAVLKNADDTCLSPIKDSPLFYRSLNKFIRELRQALIGSKDFEYAVKPVKNKKYSLLASIYSSYEKSLSSLNLTDDIGRQWSILKGLEDYAGLPPSLSNIEKIVIDGFYDLTQIQRKLVKAFIDKGMDRSIIPIYSLENPDATRLSETLLNFFETMEDLSPDSIIFSHVSRTDNGTALDYLMNNFLKENKNRDFIKDDTVNLIAAPGRYKEIEEIGREARGLLAKEVNPSDIAVVFRDIAPYGEIVIDVFKRFKIPLCFRHGISILAMPVVKNILSIYDIIESSFEREKVLKLLNSDYVDHSCFTNGKRFEFAEIERILTKTAVINEDIESWEDAIERYIKTTNDRLGILVKDLMLNFIKTLKALNKKQTFSQHKQGLCNIMEKLGFEKILLDKDKNADEYDARDCESLKVFKDTMDECKRAFVSVGKEKILLSLNEFKGILMESLRKKTVIAYSNKSGVKALSILDARGLKFKHLFICGLNDGEFPKLESPHAFIREDDKKRLNKAFRGKIFLTSNAKWWEEPLLFMLSLGMAKEKVYLSHSYLDEKGRETAPSIFFREALDILRINDKRDDRFKKIPVSDVIAKPEDALERYELAVSIVKALNSDEERGYAEDILEIAGNRNGFKDSISRILKLNSIERQKDFKKEGSERWMGGIRDFSLINKLNMEFLGAEGIWTATMLEDLAKCPFSFYASHVLKLDEMEEPDVEMNNLALGSILHRILERFFKSAKELDMLPLKGSSDEKKLLIKNAGLVFEDVERNDFIGSSGLWEVKKNQAISMLSRFYKTELEEHNREFMPEYFEIEFGKDKDIPLLEINIPDGETILIKGKIDRIDVSKKGMNIIDYKMRSIPEKYIGRVYFQIPIYTLAASNHLLKKGDKCSAFYYFLASAEKKEIKAIKDEGGGIPLHEYIFDLQNRSLANDIANLISNIRSGDFRIEPYDEKICANCRFWSVCRKERLKSEG